MQFVYECIVQCDLVKHYDHEDNVNIIYIQT